MEANWSNLVEKAKRNDQNAFYELYQNSYDAVYRAVKSMIRDDDIALDIVQDAFVKGFGDLSALENPASFLPWMKRIATNKAKDWFKKKQDVTFSQLADENGNEPDFEDERIAYMPEEVIDRDETARLIEEILSTLSDEQRMAVGMFYYQDMSVSEIAQELEISENTVKSRLNYGRKKIRAGVEALEKKGTKLYGLAPIPFLIWLFRGQMAQAAVGTAPAAVFHTVMAETAAQGAAAAGAASTAAGGSAGGGLLSTVGAKITAGVLAVIVSVGVGIGIFIGTRGNGEPELPTEPSTVISEESSGDNVSEPERETRLIVLSEEYEELHAVALTENAPYKIIPAKKNGKWGVINDKGETVVAFEYDEISTVTSSGHMLAKKKDGDKTVSTVFDANGRDLLSSENKVDLGNDIAMIAELVYDGGGMLEQVYSLEIRRLSTGETVAQYDRAGAYVCGYFSETFGVAVLNEDGYDGNLLIMNQDGEILNQLFYGGRGDNTTFSSAWGGYYWRGNAHGFIERTLSNPTGTENYTLGLDDVDCFIVDRYGTLCVFGRSEDKKQYLFDTKTASADGTYYAIQMSDFLNQKGYDYISINSAEAYLLVQDGEQWGYISRSGEEKTMYDSAGDFVNGKAIVMDGGVAYVIDDTFTRLSDGLAGYTSVSTVGENLFGVQKDGKWYLAVYSE